MSEGFSIADPIGTDEAAELLGVTESRVRQLESVLRPITIRGTKVYSRASVLRYAADRDQRQRGAR